MHFGRHWYWYGEDKSGDVSTVTNASGQPVERVDFVGISVYRSTDLMNWQRLGIALSPSNRKNHDLHPSQVLERPKVIYHPSGRFVMWVHVDRADYKLAATGVAVSDRPEGPFRYLGSIRPHGRDSRDQTVFLDDDGAAYHICSTDHNATTLVTRLSDDYQSLTAHCAELFPGRYMEAQSIARLAGRYWFLASGCTGWNPNPARSAVSDSIWGPWEELGNPCIGGDDAATTWGMQCTFLQRLDDQTLLAMFDRWRPQDLASSGYGWFTARPSDSGFVIDWQPGWNF